MRTYLAPISYHYRRSMLTVNWDHTATILTSVCVRLGPRAAGGGGGGTHPRVAVGTSRCVIRLWITSGSSRRARRRAGTALVTGRRRPAVGGGRHPPRPLYAEVSRDVTERGSLSPRGGRIPSNPQREGGSHPP